MQRPGKGVSIVAMIVSPAYIAAREVGNMARYILAQRNKLSNAEKLAGATRKQHPDSEK